MIRVRINLEEASRNIKALEKNTPYTTLQFNNSYCGLPFCIGGWWKYLNRCVEFCINYRILKRGLKLPHDYHKTKVPLCKRCDLSLYCNGVWRRYASISSSIGAIPLKIINNSDHD